MFRLAVCILAITLPFLASAQQKMFPYPYDQHDFPNGLRLISVKTDYPNVVALYIVVQTGSRNEIEPGKSGFAHFFEHVMFRGTKTVPQDEYEKALKQMGVASNANTSDDRTVYHNTLSKEDLGQILKLEADRFQNLSYSENVFRTEALAVLGEYNKNSAEPFSKIDEVFSETAYDKHTYKHTTMGFLKDIEDMPNQYAYSKTFFDRFYKPEYTTIIVVGDIDPVATRKLVQQYWGNWARGNYKTEIPAEPAHTAPRRNHIDWPTQTLPILLTGYRNAAYTDTEIDSAALDLIGTLAFSPNSDLYKKLVIQEQVADTLGFGNSDHLDPSYFQVFARLKKAADLPRVEKEILATIERLKTKRIEKDKLDAVKSRLRYELALQMNNSEAIARTLAHYVALKRTPETINRLYERYAQVTPDDLLRIAKKYFVESERVTVTLAPKQ
ncbi:MAG: insulinase family protein [Bryobacterales bacterium]|nr:insulinase family protein [Bryobacterales bacterium]